MAADNSSTCETTTTTTTTTTNNNNSKSKSSKAGRRAKGGNDPAWEHAEAIPGLRNSMICLHCRKKISGGGITRFKYHLSGVRGQVEICQKVPEEIRNHMKQLVECLSSNSTENKTKRKRKRKSLYEIVSFDPDLDPPNFNPDPLKIENYDSVPLKIQNYDSVPNEEQEEEAHEEEEQEEEEAKGDFVISTKCRVRSKKQRYTSFLSPQIVTPVAARNGSSLLDPFQTARLAIARWWYDSKVPFEAAKSSYYDKMIDAVINVGPGFKPPNYHELRGPLLKEIRDEINQYLFGVRNIWRIYGCSIMADRLVNHTKNNNDNNNNDDNNNDDNNNNQIIINFLVFSPRGTIFLKSVQIGTGTGKTNESELIEIFDEAIREVGPENVVQFITDPDTDFKAAGKALQDRYGSFFWSPCASHCIDSMLQNFSNPKYFSNIDETLKKARKITKFIYNHAWVLSLMRRDFTNGHDLIQPASTRFASHFLTLQSLLKFKKELKQLFTCPKFRESEFGKSKSGSEISSILLQDRDFWTQCQHITKVTDPLIRVLKLVDSDSKPSMGYLHHSMEGAKESIRTKLKHKSSLYAPYLRVFDGFWGELSSPIHEAGCFLNPGVYFRRDFERREVSRGLLMCIGRLVADYETQDMISAQLEEYKDAAGDFGLAIAVRQREKLNPVAWWEQFGNDTPELQRFAIRVLSQCCSATGRERNWSSFKFLHSKKQNSIEYKRLNDLVFARYNLKLRERNMRRDKELWDPISLENMDLLDEWVSEEAGLLTGEDLSWESLEPPVPDLNGEDQEQASESTTTTGDGSTGEDVRPVN